MRATAVMPARIANQAWPGLRGATAGSARARNTRSTLTGSQASGDPAKTWS